MAKLQLKREVFDRTKDRSVLTPDERETVERLLGESKGNVSINVAELPLPFLRTLLDDTRLTVNQRAVVAMQVYGMGTTGAVDRDRIYDTLVASPVEFGSTFVVLGGKTPNAEMFLNGRWYPIVLSIQFLQDNENLSRCVVLQGTLSLCERNFGFGHLVSPRLFRDEGGQARERSVLDVLQEFGFRRLQTTPTDFNLKLLKAERFSREMGQVTLVTGSAIMPSRAFWWSGFETRSLGTPELPRRAVVEPELEVAEDQRAYYAPYGQQQDHATRLPFVRLFSLDLKAYVYVDVDDVIPYEFDKKAMGKLHLPGPMTHVLTRVFGTPVEQLFGDLIRGKHGGVVVLAAGNPGVGKTLTAEVYAEHTERPLYVLELGELGTNVGTVEDNLQRVFTRVARWNAVLQFDECEIFLAQRGDDLERSAIVGSFLRLLDYYQGILFLTTNRAEVLDHAVRSRVMLKLDYPDLDHASRTSIWKTMFESAGLRLLEGSLEDLAQTVLNGRQIRNLTRLAKIMHPDGAITLPQMREVLRFGCA